MAVPGVVAISGSPRYYDWGSPSAIPELLGIPPTGEPLAELWFGARPECPSPVAGGGGLDQLIATDPKSLIGPAVAAAYADRLPFLVKILAAQRALSIQVHPDRGQAQAGYAAENAAGRSLDAPTRSYHDENHKPELLYALTPFEALCGFRPVAQIQGLFAQLAIADLDPFQAMLAAQDGLRTTFTELLRTDDAVALVRAVVNAPGRDVLEPGAARALELAAEDFPDDIGCVLTLMLNYVRLEPAEAIYLAAGNVHSYLRGVGVEIMANSDNVLRCGLTSKHVDVAELLRITDFTPLPEPRWPIDDSGTFGVPVPDFALRIVELSAGAASIAIDDPGAQIVLCASGHACVRTSDAAVDLLPGHAAFVRADASSAAVSGAGVVACARVGRSSPPRS